MNAQQLREHLVEEHGWSAQDARNAAADRLDSGHRSEHDGPNSLLHDHSS